MCCLENKNSDRYKKYQSKLKNEKNSIFKLIYNNTQLYSLEILYQGACRDTVSKIDGNMSIKNWWKIDWDEICKCRIKIHLQLEYGVFELVVLKKLQPSRVYWDYVTQKKYLSLYHIYLNFIL